MSAPLPVRQLARPPARPPAFEQLMQAMNVYPGNEFTAARQLVALIEHVAPLMSEVDRVQLGRLMASTGHTISQMGKEWR
jgi:hypothetical protein